MFDRHITNVSYGGPSKIDVNVKAAPASDTVRLYGELLAKARAEVLEQLLVENELINFQAVQLAPELGQTKTIVAFALNGQQIIAEVKLSKVQALALSREELLRAVFKLAAEAIAEKMMLASDSLHAG